MLPCTYVFFINSRCFVVSSVGLHLLYLFKEFILFGNIVNTTVYFIFKLFITVATNLRILILFLQLHRTNLLFQWCFSVLNTLMKTFRYFVLSLRDIFIKKKGMGVFHVSYHDNFLKRGRQCLLTLRESLQGNSEQ